jgi:lipopolysaccharide transport system permease protein
MGLGASAALEPSADGDQARDWRPACTREAEMSPPTTIFEPPALGRINPIAALRRLADFGDLFLTLSLHRINVRYRQSRLGLLWALLQPFAMMLVFTLMFSFLRIAPSGDVPFPLFVYAALVPWTTFSTALANSSMSLTSHAALLTKIAFPREILPLTYIVAALVDMGIASLALFALMMWFGVPLTLTALWSLPAIAVLAGLLVGLGLLFSAVQVRYRDVGLAMPVLVQMWLFATPVLYSLQAVKAALPAPLYTLYTLNPMAGVVDTFRRAVVENQPPDAGALGMSAAVVAVIVPAAYVYFKYSELTMADAI